MHFTLIYSYNGALRMASDPPIESPSFAIVLFTKEYIYIKSYGDGVFRKYKRNLRT